MFFTQDVHSTMAATTLMVVPMAVVMISFSFSKRQPQVGIAVWEHQLFSF
jgi:hypothetical protein